MSWPVFITTPHGDRINVAHIMDYVSCEPSKSGLPECAIYTIEDGDFHFRGDVSQLDYLIADAIATTAKLVARAEAEAIDEHRAAVAHRSEFYTKPASR